MLAQDLIRDSFAQIAERREWSWLIKRFTLYPTTFPSAGSVSLSPNSLIVTGSGTAFTPNLVGVQFRSSGALSLFPTYTVAAYISPTSLLLSSPWIGPTQTAVGYTLFQCYFPVPADFNYWYSLTNLAANYRLWTNTTQAEIDQCDPQRSQYGISYAASFFDYTTNYLGVIAPALQVHGAGPSPISSTSYGYTYPANSVFVVEITTGGTPGGGLAFAWKQDAGSSATITVLDNEAIDLSNGVQVYFPQAVYSQGDVWIIQCTAGTSAGPSVPRYELWPRPNASVITSPTPYVYSGAYVSRPLVLSDDSPTLPPFIRGDVILEKALKACAQFPGTESSPNPYYSVSMAQMHEASAERMIMELEIKDDDVATRDLKYENFPYSQVPWMDGSWQAVHAIYPFP